MAKKKTSTTGGSQKRFALSTTIRWTTFEVDLFRYLAMVTSRTMADNMRTAIRHYSKTLPQFDPVAFAEFMRKETLSKMPKGIERDRLTMELDGFVENTTNDGVEIVDRIGASADGHKFKASANDFNIND